MEKRRAKLEAKFQTHNFLWIDLEDIWKRMGDRQTTDHGLFTAALVLLSSCLEAHANFLGASAFPDQWTKIRDYLRTAPRRGVVGRVDYLAELLGVHLDRSQDPFAALVELERRRHQLVHPELEVIEKVVEFVDAATLEPPDTAYYEIASPEFLSRARKSVEAVSSALQKAAFEKFPRRVFGDHPFSGVLGMRGISIES